jgi:hypothetical protein
MSRYVRLQAWRSNVCQAALLPSDPAPSSPTSSDSTAAAKQHNANTGEMAADSRGKLTQAAKAGGSSSSAGTAWLGGPPGSLLAGAVRAYQARAQSCSARPSVNCLLILGAIRVGRAERAAVPFWLYEA